MRPGRILAFLLAVILTLYLLNSAAGYFKPGKWSFISRETADTALKGKEPGDIALRAGTAHADTVFNEASSLSDTTATVRAAGHEPYYPGDAIRDSLAEGKQVRVLFYGDSQLEGDRLTALLRRELRKEGGGTGPGLFSPLMPVMYTKSFVLRSSSNWTRYTLLDYRSGKLPHNSFAPMLSVCRFTPPGDTLTAMSYASVKISPVPGADSTVTKYERLRMFYGNNYDTILVTVRSGASLIDFVMLQKGDGPMEYTVSLPSVPDLTIEFTGRNSPDIYALSIEGDNGIIVDNIPVRGSAGLEFVMTDSRGFEYSFARLKPDIIFLQFGLNVVRNVRSEYNYYEEGLVRQIQYLKKASGGVPLVLVGVTDMAERSDDTIRPFRNIRAIRDAQKNAAKRTGIIFWDAWHSMGGQGSIVRWLKYSPPLSAKDLTHLSNEGADTIASRIYNDLLAVRTVRAADMDSVVAPAAPPIVPDTMIAVTESGPMARDSVQVEKHISLAALLRYHPQQTFIFTTTAFWIFFLVVIAGFALLRKKRAMCHTWLLMVSLYFYYRAGGLFIILLILTALLTWATGMMTGRAEKKAGKKFWMILNIVLLLGFLSYFKYSGFFADTVNAFFNTSFVPHDIFSAMSNRLFGTSFDVSTIVLPVGISFFTFQALSYSIDVYRGKIKPVENIVDFSFYLTYFPQLVAGPIVRASEFIPQMKGDYSVTRNEFGHGLFLILQGLVKKMLISDLISAGFIDRVFDAPSVYSGFENLMAVYGYGLQIYCDFSGYTDIAIGIAMLMGFRLPLNFNSPYKAVNVGDFWRRWHISLSRWLKDYLYIPLGGNRKGKIRTGINLMITMLLGGLWHGAALRFVIWGGMHGLALIVHRAWHRLTGSSGRHTRAGRIAGIILTFNFVSFAWIFFRSSSLENAGVMLSQIFSSFNPGNYSIVLMAYLPVLVLIISGYILHFLPVSVKEAYRGLFIRLPMALKFAAVIVVAVILYKVGTDVLQPFIYFRF
jgi:D-alanyl-lipoteichoic acid acyltransferase DltB (MBOAT superfamily)